MPNKKTPKPPTMRNPVARTAGQFNKAAIYKDKKKEQKKVGRAAEKRQDDH